ncbi:MAG: LuxR family transcriptional regulator, partial [Maritimibacter sp.]
NGYIMGDPSVVWGMMNVGAARWSEIAVPDSLGVFTNAAKHGMEFGAAFATGTNESKSFGNCARSDREFSDMELAEIQEIVIAVHAHLGAGPGLKDRQRDALRALANGLTYDQACEDVNRHARLTPVLG